MNIENKNKENQPVKKDYTAKRKKIYKGKIAPLGTLYLELKLKRKGKKFSACKLIEGGLGSEAEKIIVTQLYLEILKKYFPEDIEEIENKKKLNK